MENQLVSYDDFSNKITIDRTRQILTYSKWIQTRVGELTKQVRHTSLDPEYN